MIEYEKPYGILFNCISDAILAIDRQDYITAKAILILAQQNAEEEFIASGTNAD